MADITEIRQPGSYSYVFSPYPEPVATVDPGQTVAIHTEDAFEGRITTEQDLPSKVLSSYLNPQTGPIYVNAPSRATRLRSRSSRSSRRATGP